MKKALLLSFSFALFVAFGFSQTGKYWTANLENRSAIIKNKAVARLTFPTEFKLYHLDLASIKQQLYKVVDNSVSHTTVISLPNACLLYTSDAADERSSVDLGGRRIIKKKSHISIPI